MFSASLNDSFYMQVALYLFQEPVHLPLNTCITQPTTNYSILYIRFDQNFHNQKLGRHIQYSTFKIPPVGLFVIAYEFKVKLILALIYRYGVLTFLSNKITCIQYNPLSIHRSRISWRTPTQRVQILVLFYLGIQATYTVHSHMCGCWNNGFNVWTCVHKTIFSHQ